MGTYRSFSFKGKKYAQIRSFLAYAATLTKKSATTKTLVTIAAQFGESDFFVPDVTPTQLAATVDGISDELAADEYRVDGCPIVTRNVEEIFRAAVSKTYGEERASENESVYVEIYDVACAHFDCTDRCHCYCYNFIRHHGKCYSASIKSLPTVTALIQKIVQKIREADEIATRSMIWEFTSASESEFAYGTLDFSDPVSDALHAIGYSAGNY